MHKKNSKVLQLLNDLETILKQDDLRVLYDFMSDEFKSRVSIENYLLLEKYRINLNLPLSLVKVYETGNEKIMLRVKQFPETNFGNEVFANIVFVKENEKWKLRDVLI